MDQKDLLKQVKISLDQAIQQKKMFADFAKNIGPAIVDVLKPILKEIASNSKLPKDEITNAISKIKVDIPNINVEVPKIDTPIVNYTPPEIKINVPPLDIRSLAAKIQIPNEMSIKGWVGFMGYDRGLLSDPLPVQIRDANGKPVIFGGGGAIIAGGGGGIASQVKVNNPATEPVNVTIVGGANATSATNIVDSSGVAYSGSNPMPVEGTVAVSGINDSVAATLIDSSGVGYSGSNPIPVGGSVAVSGITGSIGATILNGEGLARDSWVVSQVLGSVAASLTDSSGIGYSGSNPLPVAIASGAANTSASNIVDSSGVAYSGSNPIPITLAVSNATTTVNVRVVDSSGVGYDGSNGMPIRLASGTNASLSCHLEDSSGIGYNGSNPMWVRVSSAGNTTGVNIHDSSGVSYSGSNPLPTTLAVSNPTSTVNAVIVDSSGIGYNGSNPIPVGGTVLVSDITASVKSALIDSIGQQYSGSNPVPIKIVSGALTSTIVVGPTPSDAIDDASAPLKIGGIARTTNPDAVAGGDIVSTSYDDLGRQLTRPVQVRDLIRTAYVTENEVEEVVLLAGAGAWYHDLIYVLAANESTAAINLDIRQTKGGTVQMSLEVPANGTAGVSLPVPIPQGDLDASWTVQNSAADNSNTVYSVTALFSKEI